MAALIVRVHHSIWTGSLAHWLLVFADDFLAVAGGSGWAEPLAGLLLLLDVLGVPLSWKKVGRFPFSWGVFFGVGPRAG